MPKDKQPAQTAKVLAILDLPNEILEAIVELVSEEDLVKLSLTNKRFFIFLFRTRSEKAYQLQENYLSSDVEIPKELINDEKCRAVFEARLKGEISTPIKFKIKIAACLASTSKKPQLYLDYLLVFADNQDNLPLIIKAMRAKPGKLSQAFFEELQTLKKQKYLSEEIYRELTLFAPPLAVKQLDKALKAAKSWQCSRERLLQISVLQLSQDQYDQALQEMLQILKAPKTVSKTKWQTLETVTNVLATTLPPKLTQQQLDNLLSTTLPLLEDNTIMPLPGCSPQSRWHCWEQGVAVIKIFSHVNLISQVTEAKLKEVTTLMLRLLPPRQYANYQGTFYSDEITRAVVQALNVLIPRLLNSKETVDSKDLEKTLDEIIEIFPADQNEVCVNKERMKKAAVQAVQALSPLVDVGQLYKITRRVWLFLYKEKINIDFRKPLVLTCADLLARGAQLNSDQFLKEFMSFLKPPGLLSGLFDGPVHSEQYDSESRLCHETILKALALLAPKLPAQSRELILDNMLMVFRSCKKDFVFFAVDALVSLVPHLPQSGLDKLLKEKPSLPVPILIALIPQLKTKQLKQAVDSIFTKCQDDNFVLEELCAIAPYLNESQANQAKQKLQCAFKMDLLPIEREQVVRALSALARQLPGRGFTPWLLAMLEERKNSFSQDFYYGARAEIRFWLQQKAEPLRKLNSPFDKLLKIVWQSFKGQQKNEELEQLAQSLQEEATFLTEVGNQVKCNKEKEPEEEKVQKAFVVAARILNLSNDQLCFFQTKFSTGPSTSKAALPPRSP